MLNGWLRRKHVDYNLTGLIMQWWPLKTEVFTRHLNIYLFKFELISMNTDRTHIAIFFN